MTSDIGIRGRQQAIRSHIHSRCEKQSLYHQANRIALYIMAVKADASLWSAIYIINPISILQVHS